MEEYLKKLLTESNFQLDNETIEKREKAIIKFSKMKQGVLNKSLELIRLVFSLDINETIINEFRQYFINTDSEYPTQGNTFDLKVLATATLCYLIRNNPFPSGAILSLAVVNCFGFGLRDKPKNLDINTFAELSLKNLLIESRNIPKVDQIEAKFDIGASFFDEYKTALEQSQPANQFEAIKKMTNELTTKLNNYSKDLNGVIDYLDSSYQILREESDILWWIIANYSRGFQKSWSTLDPLGACLAIGIELSDLVLIPGPLSYEDLIKGVLRCYGDQLPQLTTIEKVISKIPNNWKKSLVDNTPSNINDLTPLHYAIKKSLEYGFDDNWSESIKNYKINLSRRMPPLKFAAQVYRESVYLKMLKRNGD